MKLAKAIRKRASDKGQDSTIGIASLIGVATGPVKDILNGTGGRPAQRTLEKIAAFLDLSVDKVEVMLNEAPSLGRSEDLPLALREYEVAVLRVSLLRIAAGYGLEKPAVVQQAENDLQEAREAAESHLIARALNGVSPRVLQFARRLSPADQAAVETLLEACVQGDDAVTKELRRLAAGGTTKAPKSPKAKPAKSRK